MRLALAALAVALPAWSQELTGSLLGTVSDATGQPLPAVQIQLSGSTLVRARILESTNTGAFHATSLPPGEYSIQATLPDFTPVTQSGIRVSLGQAAHVDLRLQLAAVKSSVQVTAGVHGVDGNNSAITENVPASVTSRLPRSRGFDSLLTLAPGLRNEPKSGQFQIDGASGSENVFSIEGVEVTDVYSGLLPSNFQIPFEFVQEFQVQSSGFEANYPAAAGGVVSVVLRSGGNAFHGSAGLYARTDALNAGPSPTLLIDPANDERLLILNPRRDGLRVLNPTLTLGGPIRRNRLWLFTGISPQFTRTTRTVTPILGGAPRTGTSTETARFLSSKLDFAPANRLRIYASHQSSSSRGQGRLPLIQGTDNPSADLASPGYRQPTKAYRAGAGYTITPRLQLTARGGFVYNNYKETGVPVAPYLRYRTSNLNLPGVPNTLRATAGDFTPTNYQIRYSKLNRLNLNADLAYTFTAAGRHQLRAGLSRNQLFHQIDAGFASGLFVIFWDRAYSGTLSSQRPARGQYGYYIYRRSGYSGDVTSDNSGFYLQDNWQLGRLTVNAGFRMDREFVPSYRTGTGIPPRPIQFGLPEKFAPRLGVAWDVLGAGRWKLAASYSRYFDQMKYALPIVSLGGSYWKDFIYTLDDPAVGKLNPANTPGTLLDTIDFRIPLASSNNNRIDPNLEPFRKHSVDIFSEHTLTPRLTLRARYARNRLDRTIEHVGVLVDGGLTGYLSNPGYHLSAATGLAPTPRATRNYDAAEFRLLSTPSAAWFLSLSYTWSRLWGNYSGLASADEYGRAEPNVTQTFDFPWGTYDSHGQPVYGRLPTDRPQVLKAFLSYQKPTRWGTTTLAPVVQALSGTPVSTRLRVMGMQTFPDGRSDRGRTPFFTNIDLLLRQEFPLPRLSESRRLSLEIHILNVLNQANVTEINAFYIHPNDGGITFDNPTDYFKGFDYRRLTQSRGLRLAPDLGANAAFQAPREIRLGLAFSF